ncbi:hypothetical protein C4565_04600 [Candidatus Parcubacteria bacterium]|jgi:flagellar basal body-associated protein FliL|nr:MAG: hypothetical protein C4565_04600 [Candidatus Parcubacteria bacterium]
MEEQLQQNTPPTQPVEEKKSGKLWLIILALVILVCIVLFAMSNTTKAPENSDVGVNQNEQNVPAVTTTTTQEVDTTTSIEESLTGLNIGDITADMESINKDIEKIQ